MSNRIFEIVQDINGRVGLHWDDEDKHELAELIVKECAMVLTQHGTYFSGEGEPYHYAASLIEEHFGVEE
jgi:hypothetical protein